MRVWGALGPREVSAPHSVIGGCSWPECLGGAFSVPVGDLGSPFLTGREGPGAPGAAASITRQGASGAARGCAGTAASGSWGLLRVAGADSSPPLASKAGADGWFAPQICCPPRMARSRPCSSCWRSWTSFSITWGKRLTDLLKCWTSTTHTSSWRAWRASTWSSRTTPSLWSRSWWTAGTRWNTEWGQVGSRTLLEESLLGLFSGPRWREQAWAHGGKSTPSSLPPRRLRSRAVCGRWECLCSETSVIDAPSVPGGQVRCSLRSPETSF